MADLLRSSITSSRPRASATTHSPARGIAREIERKLKEGRGKGSGRNYKPWICVTEISSRGRSHEIEGWKVGRTHHLLSDLERDAFYIFQWTQNITDIREQFPLPLKQTIAIARQLGVRHPGEQNYGTPIVITLDFLLSKIAANGKKLLEANDCKYTDDLDERSLEKLEIARRWCEKHNISWALVTEQEIDSELVANLRFIDGAFHYDDELREKYRRSGARAQRFDVGQLVGDLAEQMKAAPDASLSSVCRGCDDRFGFAQAKDFGAGTCLKLARFALVHRIWRVPMGRRINPMEPAQIADFAHASI
jgi:hypothetical protein